MRFIIQAAILCTLLALSCSASYDTMPTPPPETLGNKTKPEDDRGRAKRGIHWYRSPDCATATQQMALADKYFKEQRFHKAANAYQALVYAWPDSPEAPRAQFALARAQEQRELFVKAFDEYQYLFDYYPGHFDYMDVLNRQFKLANYLMATPRGAWLFFHGFQAPERALPLFEKIIRNAPTGPQAAIAQLDIGIIHETNDELEEAIAAYEILQNRYNDENLLPQASFREAHCLYKLYLDRPNDENACNAARAGLVQYIRTYPQHEQVEKAREYLKITNTQQEARALNLARYYDRIAHRPKAAIVAYEEFLRTYTSSEFAPDARQRLEALRKEVNSHEKK